MMDELDAAVAALSARGRCGLAAACAERAFPILARAGGVLADPEGPLVGDVPAALALELAWLAAEGAPVSEDEARWAELAVADEYEAVYHDLLGPERGALRALLGAVRAVFDGGGVRAATDGLIEAVDGFDASTVDDELAWLTALIARSRGLAAGTLTRAAVVGDDRPPRWIVHLLTGQSPDEPFEDDLDGLVSDWEEPLARAAVTRRRRVGERRAGQVVPPWRAPSGIPARYQVREVGRGPSASEGKLAVSGHRHHALVDAATGEVLFAPPGAVALGMSRDLATLVSWRVERRPDASGVGRGDYDWIVERYRWPERALASRHVVAARTLIEWHTPGHLVVPADGGDRLVVLTAHSEDATAKLYVVSRRDGTVGETEDRDEALRWLAPATDF